MKDFFLRFHPSERVAISASEDGTCRVWDLSTSKCVKVLAAHSKEHEVLRACWAPPGSTHDSIAAATGSADGVVRLWGLGRVERGEGECDGVTGVERYQALRVVGCLRHRNQSKGLDGQVYSCQFVSDQAGGASAGTTRLLTASDNSVHLWDLETCKRETSRALSKVGDHSVGGERNPSDLSFVFDAKPRPGARSDVLAVALSDGTVRVGDILRGRGQPSVLRCRNTATQTGLAWSHDGTILASCGGDGAVTLWDARTWTIMSTLCGHSRSVYGAAFYPGAGRESEELSTALLLSWSSDETICMWGASRGPVGGTAQSVSVPLASIAVEQGFPIYSCSVSADGRQLAVAGGGSGKAGLLGVPIKLVCLDDEPKGKGGMKDNGISPVATVGSTAF